MNSSAKQNKKINDLLINESSYTRAPKKGANTPIRFYSKKLGPITTRLLSRTLMVYLGVYAIALLFLTLETSTAVEAFSLGMMLPGGGLIYSGHPILALFILLLFFAALTANKFAAPTIWTATALMGALFADNNAGGSSELLIPIFCMAWILWIKVRSDKRYAKAKKAGEKLVQTLKTNDPLTLRSQPGALGEELSAADLAHAKFILDRALQPIEEFNGLKELEPYGTSALRYQLNYAQYALAMLNYSHTPAFSGYLKEGQRRLIEKMTDLRAWGYWRGENRWGNLDSSPDPIYRDNIMFSGYLGQMLGTYATVTGDHQFNHPGALHFKWDQHQYFNYHQESIAEKILENFQRSPFCLYPCEPNWAYTMCNPFGINSLLLTDQLYGTDFKRLIEKPYRDALIQEFMTPDGRFVPIRSLLWGINIPGFQLEVNDALAIFLHHPSLPDLAETSWEMMRYRCFDPNRDRKFFIHKMGRTDIGLYRSSIAGPFSAMMLAAKEMGDMEVYQALLEEMEQRHKGTIVDGELVHDRMSNLTSFMLAMAKFMRPASFHDIMNEGMPSPWVKGPMLIEAPYPDILVYQAVSDGHALQLGLQASQPGKHAIKLGQLKPEKEYRLVGNTGEQRLKSTNCGELIVQVPIEDRLSMVVVPVS